MEDSNFASTFSCMLVKVFERTSGCDLSASAAHEQYVPLEVTQTTTTAATSWQMNVYVGFLLNSSGHSGVLGSHDECERGGVFTSCGRPTRRLRGLRGDEAPCWLPSIKYSKCSSHNQTHCISLLFNLVSAHSSVSSDSCWVSLLRSFNRTPFCLRRVAHYQHQSHILRLNL